MQPHFHRCCLMGTALLLAIPAHASLDRMNSSTGNPSMAFIALDPTGTPTSLFVDLGSLLSDFDPVGAFPLRQDDEGNQVPPTGTPGPLLAPGTTVAWDFRANTLSVNGVAQAGTYLWADELAKFEAAAQNAETGWAVIGGSSGWFPNYFFTTGAPSATQLTNQISINSANMIGVDTLFANQYGKGTIPGVGITNDISGAHAQVGGGDAATGYVGNPTNFGTLGTWRATLQWSAFRPVGESSGVYVLNDEFDTEDLLPGTFNYSNGVLTWQTTPIPEPTAIAMALVGLGVLGATRRRRTAAAGGTHRTTPLAEGAQA